MNTSRKSKIQIINADCERWIVDQPDDCVDVVILDPPYKWQYVDNIVLESMRVSRGPVILMHPLQWDYEGNPRPTIQVDQHVGRRIHFELPIDSDLGEGVAPFDVFKIESFYHPCELHVPFFPFVPIPKDGDHAGQKPAQILVNLLHLLNVEVGTLLDLFMGSGMFGEAAKFMNMDYIGVEIDAKWCEQAKEMLKA